MVYREWYICSGTTVALGSPPRSPFPTGGPIPHWLCTLTGSEPDPSPEDCPWSTEHLACRSLGDSKLSPPFPPGAYCYPCLMTQGTKTKIPHLLGKGLLCHPYPRSPCGIQLRPRLCSLSSSALVFLTPLQGSPLEHSLSQWLAQEPPLRFCF